MQVPKWLKAELKDSDLAKIEKTVHDVEHRTSGEIVPIIVRSSSTVGHVPFLLLLIGLLLMLAIELPLSTALPILSSWWIWPVQLLLLVLVVRLLAPLDFIERLLTSHADQLLQVERRAQLEFYQSKIQQTKDATGILIFISLLEHKVVVLADSAISSKLPAETWAGVIQEIVKGIRSENFAEGLCRGIQVCGGILATHFPASTTNTNTNELSNTLIIKE